MFKQIDPRPNLSKQEEEVLKFWEDNKIFEKSLEQTKKGQPFVFYEGPPTANGKPGLHHVEAMSFKDLIPRYQTMKGRYVLRKAGWDTHGLAVEIQVEKSLGISGKKQIESIKPTVRESIIEFNRLCKASVWQYKQDWEKLTRRMGFWLDMENPYVTYHNSYIESIWYILKKISEKKLLYRGHKVVPYCPRCGTALSSHEVAQGYKTVTDSSVYVKFKVMNHESRITHHGDIYILSWTTTPWTLPGNVALAVGADIDYVKVKVGKEFWILAKDRLGSVIPDSIGDLIVEEFKGKDLVGFEYKPLFNIEALKSPKSYKVYAADFVITTDGTGVVHTAVMYGEDDYVLGEKVGLPKHHTVDESAKFTSDVPELAGAYVKDKQTEKKIFEILEKNNNLLKTEPYTHEYPHCWRCDTSLLYYARDSWFIAMSKLKKELLANNEQVNWVPEHIKHGRFGEWLANVKDWAISRERYWGTPLPVWQCEKCNEYKVVGSIKELGLSTNIFYFSRHGESEHNLKGIINGDPNLLDEYDLTEAGIKRAEILAEKLRAAGGVDLIFSSDFTRTRHTAEIVAKYLGKKVTTDPRLREYNVGVFNGKRKTEYEKEWPISARWENAPENGETHKQIQERLLSFIRETDKKYKNKKILVVSHGDPLWVLQQYYRSEKGYPKYADAFKLEVEIHDLHRPFIDDVILKCDKCGGKMTRNPAVLDVWFDSGSMPYAQWHWPFDNHDIFKEQFPADYISEAIDQTRGWFYTLLAISTLLDKGPAYKNVINLGHLLDESGQKMSKSKGNMIDPWVIINKQGIDALRWYMYSINQPGDSKLFAEKDVDKVVRKNFLTLWNVLSFFVTYARFDNWKPGKNTPKLAAMDEWMLARSQELVIKITTYLDNFDIFHAARSIEEFINELSTWYVRRSRNRKGDAVYFVLYEVLKTLSRLMAPFTPFLAESIHSVLAAERDRQSVHLEAWPESKELNKDQKALLAEMEVVREAASIGLDARKQLKFGVKQPLNAMALEFKQPEAKLGKEMLEILKEELNVKEVVDVGSAQQRGFQSYSGTKHITKFFLDSTLTKELKLEGLARKLERAVQDLRKKTGLKVGQLAKLVYNTEDEELIAAFKLFDTKKTYVEGIEREPKVAGEVLDIGGKKIIIKL